MMWNQYKSAMLIGIIIISIAQVAHASILRWHFSDTTFYDGTNVTGYFDYNTESGQIELCDIATVAGTNTYVIGPNGTSFTPGNTYSSNIGGWGGQMLDTDNDYLWQSITKFEDPVVYSDNGDGGTSRIRYSLKIINDDSSGMTLDLSVAGTYSQQVSQGNLGSEVIDEYVDYPDGSYTHSMSGRYLNSFTISAEVIPEPTSLFLLGSGLVGIVGVRLRKQNRITGENK